MTEYNLYRNHIGGFFAVESDGDYLQEYDYDGSELGYEEYQSYIHDEEDIYNPANYDPLFCETCGDYDVFVGSFDCTHDLPLDDEEDYENFLESQARILGEY